MSGVLAKRDRELVAQARREALEEAADEDALAEALHDPILYSGDWETQTTQEIATEIAHQLALWLRARAAGGGL